MWLLEIKLRLVDVLDLCIWAPGDLCIKAFSIGQAFEVLSIGQAVHTHHQQTDQQPAIHHHTTTMVKCLLACVYQDGVGDDVRGGAIDQ